MSTVHGPRPDPAAVFREVSAEDRVQSLPLSHLSIELGHLYMEDFAAGPHRLREHFAAVAPWAQAARTAAPTGTRPRVSTCFLVDDYFTRFSSPAEVVPRLVAAAAESGLTIDYLARESACAVNGAVSPASLLAARLVPAPAEGGNGARPATEASGWLCNGARSTASLGVEAMAPRGEWRPPREFGARRHSVFLDVELWDDDGPRTWSCPFLAAVWQLLRLGLLRDRGEAVVEPVDWPDPPFPDDWDDLPGLIRLNPRATPFAAYRTFSLLETRFLPVEHAVRLILEHTAVDTAVREQIAARARAENMPEPRTLTERIAYAFVPEPTGGSRP